MELCFLPKDNEACVLKDEFVFWDFFNLTPADYCPHDGDDDNQILLIFKESKIIDWNIGSFIKYLYDEKTLV